MSFILHPQLAADFHVLGRSGNLQVLLRRIAVLPWFLLVPECAALELYEIAPPLRRVCSSAVVMPFGSDWIDYSEPHPLMSSSIESDPSGSARIQHQRRSIPPERAVILLYAITR